MQQMMIYWQSIVPQHVSGVFTPINRRADRVSLPVVFCPGCNCCGSGESGSEMCALCGWFGGVAAATTATTRTEHHRQ